MTLSFDVFWQVYPRKQKKVAALKAWKKIRTSDTTIHEILAGVARWKLSQQWQDAHYIPLPSTWITNRQWEDELPVTHPGHNYDPREPGLPGKCKECGAEIPAGFLKCLKCINKQAPAPPPREREKK